MIFKNSNGSFPSDPRSPALIRGSMSSSRRARISLTMIVRDEERNLPAGLTSVEGLCDETVVVDTESTDPTAAIAGEFGARVFDFVWVNDFAVARNAALARATGDYAFWLDADDVVDPQQRIELQALTIVCDPGSKPSMWSAARAIRGRTAMAGRRWSTIFDCFRYGRTCAGRMRCTSRSCLRCDG